MKFTNHLFMGALLGCLAVVGNAGASHGPSTAPAGTPATELPWTRVSVEHLFNRAGFGARKSEISRALKRTPEEVVDDLLNGGKRVQPPHYEQGTVEDLKAADGLPRSQKRRIRAIQSRDDRAQLHAYAYWWMDRMVAHDDPLRDRMTLFWHGLFATSYSTVKRSYDMIEEHQMIRQRALGNYGDLLHGIVRDPAMLYFLDNQKNKKGSPNENLGRELLELFSLGEGNYTEQDVKEVARALTGESRDDLGNYKFLPKHHDAGRKTILGETGRYRATDVVEIILRQTACSRYIAGRLLAYFEGVEPDDLRVTEYAAYLKRNDYELKPFLRKLLLDPRFYSEEVIAARVAGPVDYMVGSARRLNARIDSEFLYVAASELGQRLFDPPSVKGWDEGDAWITTGSLLARGNTMGMVLGTIDFRETFRPLRAQRDALAEPKKARKDRSTGDDEEPAPEGEESSMGGMMSGGDTIEEDVQKDDLPKEIAVLLRTLGGGYRPDLNLTLRMKRIKDTSDERVVDGLLRSLLAIEAPPETRQRVLDYYSTARTASGLNPKAFLKNGEVAEPILRRTAHLILSLPEAQLN